MKTKLLVILTIITILIVWWMINSDDKQVSTADNSQMELVPEFTAKLLHQELYDSEGRLQQEVFSQSMEHYSELALTHFKKPEFIIYQDNTPYWRLSANIGTLHEGSLILDEDVIMVQIVDNALVNKIATEYIDIDLDNNIVKSDMPISITGKNVVIRGKGLTADLNAGTIKLTNHVRTTIQ